MAGMAQRGKAGGGHAGFLLGFPEENTLLPVETQNRKFISWLLKY
jgi:hypothetical protein